MTSPLLKFDHGAREIEDNILRVVSENERMFDEIEMLPTLTPEKLINTLEEMDANLAQVCSSIQHLLNVYPKPVFIEGYQLAAPTLYQYANKLTQSNWLKNKIDIFLKTPLSLEQKSILKSYQRMMQSSGCYLDVDGKIRLAECQERLNAASELFEYNIQCSSINVATKKGEITIDDAQFQDLMMNEDNSAIRQSAYQMYNNKASGNLLKNEAYDNAATVVNIANARLELANVFGYKNYWDYSVATKKFAETCEIEKFLQDILQRCVPKCRAILEEIKQTLSLEKEILPWDIDYYLHQAIQKKHGIHFNEIKSYYPITAVLDGLMKLAHQLFGIDIKMVMDVNTWHKDIMVFEVSEQGKLLGIVYADLFIRDHKRKSSWVDSAQTKRKLANGGYQVPIAFLNCNFSPETPSLLTQNDLITLLHEFGHVLHHLLAGSDYATLSGMSGASLDEVEIPSMFFEKFAFDKNFINLFSSHYLTNEPMPSGWLENMKASYQWIAPIKLITRLKMALLDYQIHSISHQVNEEDINTIVANVNKVTQIFPENSECEDWYKSASLVFTSQYAAGYYSYLWAEMIAADLFYTLFREGDINCKKGKLFRETILAPGGLFELNSAANTIFGRHISKDAFFYSRNII